MSRVRLLRSLVSVGVSGGLLAASGCGTLDQLEDGGATVYVFSTHHATPIDGIFPARGEEDMPRVFDNDLGWQITLQESYITTASVTLVRCNSEPVPLNMFWGPCPEDMSDEDLAALTVAGNSVSPGDFCGLEVEYGPYTTPVVDASNDTTRHQTPENESVMGATVYLRGAARMGELEPVVFELRATGDLTVELDMSQLEGNGNPMTVAHSEDFPKELTVSKTYDRFFDGIDFAAFDAEALEDELLDILEAETRVSDGTRVQMDEGEEG